MTKEERKEYNKLYYINNKETIIKQTQQYYTNNKEIYDSYSIISLFLNIDTYLKNLVSHENSVVTGLKGLNTKSSSENKKLTTYLFSGTPPNPNPQNLKPLINKNLSCNTTKEQINNAYIINYLKYISILSRSIPLSSTALIPGLTTGVPSRYFIDLRYAGVAEQYATFLTNYIMNCT